MYFISFLGRCYFCLLGPYLSSLRSIYAEGGILRFYRGILPEIAGMVPKSAMMYAGNALIRRVLVEQNGGVLDNKVGPLLH